MSEILDISRELKEELDKLPLFIEFKRVKALYDSNPELRELKKNIVRAKNENRMDDYNKFKSEFDINPLVSNYLTLKEEVENYLREVSKEIQK